MRFPHTQGEMEMFSGVTATGSRSRFVWELQVGDRCLSRFRLVGDKVFQGEITEREKENGDKVKEKRNKTAEDNG